MPNTRSSSSTKSNRLPKSAGKAARPAPVDEEYAVDLDDVLNGQISPKKRRNFGTDGVDGDADEEANSTRFEKGAGSDEGEEKVELSELALTDLAEFFGQSGPLAEVLDGYEMRPSQLEMAQAVKRALLNPSVALIEAPTGTGKSIAYLLPAILSGKTVIIATANKSLQNQLYSKDIPFLRQVLKREIDAVVVKGRSNFVCMHKWDKELQEQRYIAMYDREDTQAAQLQSWLQTTESGDVDDLPFVLNPDLRPRVVSFPDDCLHNDCRYFDDQCWVNIMRDRAAEAQILITNHHLLLNALELGFAGERILPPASVYVIDEAHQLEQTATSVYETSVTDYTVEQLLARTVFREQLGEDELDALRMLNTLAFQEVSNLSRENSFRFEVELEQMRRLGNALTDLHKLLKQRNPYANKEAVLNQFEGGKSESSKLEGSKAENSKAGSSKRGPSLSELNTDDAEARRTYELAMEAVSSTATKILTICTQKHDSDFVRFAIRIFDRRHISLELHAAPINPASLLTKYLFHATDEQGAPLPRTVVCTSATLATNGAFEHFKARCGIVQTSEELVLPTVFDYPNQALLYQPALPPFDFKAAEAYYDAASKEIERLIEVSRGRTLCLFTSWSGLQQVNDRLQNPAAGVIWPLRAQGDAPRNALLTWFKDTPNGVLLATRSFWEGVDIPGDTLSLVVMDKLPFPSPGDPLHSARMKALEDAGHSSFGEYMTPLMTLTLKQGFGRLIRRAADKGVVAILDERLSSKGYGRQSRGDLPPAPFSRDFRDVHRFYQRALNSNAEFALNVWAKPSATSKLVGLDDGSARSMRWRWQLLRLVDGKADSMDGLLQGATAAEAELHAIIAGLMDLKRRVEQGKRKPNDFVVEVRCSLSAAELAITGKTPAWAEARHLWGGLHFVWIDRNVPVGA
jgi:ATP-dependent DNA helicase DinG